MKDGFIFDGKPSFWQRLKKSWLGIFIAVCLLGIVGYLTIPDYVTKTIECQKWNLGFADPFSDTCSKKFSDIIFVIGDTKNTPAPKLNQGFNKYLISSLKDDDSRISAISVSDPSRNPREIIAKSETEIDSDGEYKEAIQEVENYLAKMSATKNGADYLEAIRSATEYAEDKSSTLIYVIGSGLSDEGLINFADDELLNKSGVDYEAKSIASQVYETIEEQGNSDIKELKGVSIIWDNIGQVVDPQPAISRDSLKKLTEIYKTILTKLGASSVIFKNSSANSTSAPTTNTVKISKSPAPKTLFHEQYSGNETEVFQFKGDSAEFINRTASEEKAKHIIEIAKTSSNSIIHIEAFMSRGRGNCNKTDLTSQDKALLNSRLNAVKGLFQGIDESRITTELGGFGTTNECPNGVYDENQAKNNRIVEILVDD